jgi:hypothetical protein
MQTQPLAPLPGAIPVITTASIPDDGGALIPTISINTSVRNQAASLVAPPVGQSPQGMASRDDLAGPTLLGPLRFGAVDREPCAGGGVSQDQTHSMMAAARCPVLELVEVIIDHEN